jgi:hypothetical protein
VLRHPYASCKAEFCYWALGSLALSMWAFIRQFCSYHSGFVKEIIPQSFAILPHRETPIWRCPAISNPSRTRTEMNSLRACSQ